MANELATQDQFSDTLEGMMPVLRLAGGVLATYHGYKRDNSLGWALAWGMFGTLSPFITTTVAVAQGYGQRKTG